MATVDPEAGDGFRESQRRQLQGLSSLGLAEYRLDLRLDDSGDLSAAAVDLYPGTSRRLLAETRQYWRLDGYDEAPAIDRLWITYVERDGRWYAAGDSDVADLGLSTPRGLWDGGPVVVTRTERVAVISHPDKAGRAGEVAALAGAAIPSVGSWSWPGKVVVVVPSSADELRTVLRTTLDVSKFVAFVTYDAEPEPEYRSGAPRLYVQDENLSRRSPSFQQETLLHEMVHAAAAPVDGPRIPSWVHEGLADWVAAGRPLGGRPPRGSDGRLPDDHDLATGSRDAIVVSYAEGRTAMGYLAGRAGIDAPAAFFRTLGGYRAEPGSDSWLVDRALREVTGGAMGLAELEAGWARR